MKLPLTDIFHRLRAFLKRYYLILIVIFALVINYFLYSTIYVAFFLHVGKPIYVGEIHGIEQPVLFYFDKYEETRINDQETFQLVGWAFPKELNQPFIDYQKQIVLINDQSIGYYFDSVLNIRKGVTEHYKELGVNLDQSGFTAYISKYVLPKGKYNIAILLFKTDGSQSILFKTNYYLLRTANNLQYIGNQ